LLFFFYFFQFNQLLSATSFKTYFISNYIKQCTSLDNKIAKEIFKISFNSFILKILKYFWGVYKNNIFLLGIYMDLKFGVMKKYDKQIKISEF